VRQSIICPLHQHHSALPFQISLSGLTGLTGTFRDEMTHLDFQGCLDLQGLSGLKGGRTLYETDRKETKFLQKITCLEEHLSRSQEADAKEQAFQDRQKLVGTFSNVRREATFL